MRTPRRILHVVDRTTGGVPASVVSYVQHGSDEIEHHVLSPFEADGSPAPVWDDLPVQHHDLGHGTLSRIRRVRAVARSLDPEVIHGHSSFAGAYFRLGASRKKARLVYTPHCYSFARTDLSSPLRGFYYVVEWLLGWRTDLVAACAQGEAELARGMRSIGHRADVIPNIASVAEVLPTAAPLPGQALRVGMLGRVSPQKDPAAYIDIVEALRSADTNVEAIWIGAGDETAQSTLEAAGIHVSGWLGGTQLRDELASLDVYLHSAAWEGFPIAILDAHALGLPILVRPITAWGRMNPLMTTTGGLEGLVRGARSPEAFTRWRDQNRALWDDYLKDNTSEKQRQALDRVWEPK